jgi:hypothetical protein
MLLQHLSINNWPGVAAAYIELLLHLNRQLDCPFTARTQSVLNHLHLPTGTEGELKTAADVLRGLVREMESCLE